VINAMKWKLAGVALAAVAIGAAVPIAAAQPNGNTDHGNPSPPGRAAAQPNGNTDHGNPSPPGQSVASAARSGAPSAVLGVLQSLHPDAPGLKTALSHFPPTPTPTPSTPIPTPIP
jgi:hypothetical protein